MNKQAYKIKLKKQNGISLLMALVLLAGIMMLGVLTYTVSDTQFKQSGNQQFQSAALNEAEAGLTAAETWLLKDGLNGNRMNVAFDTGGTSSKGLYPKQVMTNPPKQLPFDLFDSAEWATKALQVTGSSTQQYFIERTQNNVCKPGFSQTGGGCLASVNVYRVVARGISAKGAQRIVETTFVLDVP